MWRAVPHIILGYRFVCVAHEITMKSSLTSSVNYYVIDLSDYGTN